MLNLHSTHRAHRVDSLAIFAPFQANIGRVTMRKVVFTVNDGIVFYISHSVLRFFSEVEAQETGV